MQASRDHKARQDGNRNNIPEKTDQNINIDRIKYKMRYVHKSPLPDTHTAPEHMCKERADQNAAQYSNTDSDIKNTFRPG